ncbi:Clp protease ClpE, partial [Escherichia coli]|nr:Clp protease ClpE [Escherichia coli]
VKGNVVKVDSLNDWGSLQTWTINKKKPTAPEAAKAEKADATELK